MRLRREAEALVEIGGHQGILVPGVGCSLLSVQHRLANGGGVQWFCQWMKVVENVFNKIRALAHQGIAKAAKICPVLLFSKNICRVAFATNVCHSKSPIFNPLAN
jgi:hypothetical protein